MDFDTETKRMVDSWYGHPLSNHLANNVNRTVFMKDIQALLKWVRDTTLDAAARLADEKAEKHAEIAKRERSAWQMEILMAKGQSAAELSGRIRELKS